jgi:hypothetical protein
MTGADHERLVEPLHHPRAGARCRCTYTKGTAFLVCPEDFDLDNHVFIVCPDGPRGRGLTDARLEGIVPLAANLFETGRKQLVRVAPIHQSPQLDNVTPISGRSSAPVAFGRQKLYRRRGPVHWKLCKAGSLLYGLCEVIPTNREPQSVLRHTDQGDPP